jgi:hypothetical protein
MKIKNIFILSTLALGLASVQAFAESSNYFKTANNNPACGTIAACVIPSALIHTTQHQSHDFYRRHLNPGFAVLAP